MYTDELEDAIYEAYEYGEIDEYDRDYLLESLDDIIYERNMENKKKKNEYILKTGGGNESKRKEYYNDGKGSDGDGVKEHDVWMLRMGTRSANTEKDYQLKNGKTGKVSHINDPECHRYGNIYQVNGKEYSSKSRWDGKHDRNVVREEAELRRKEAERRRKAETADMKKKYDYILEASRECIAALQKAEKCEAIESLGYSSRLLSLIDAITKNKEKLEATQKVQESAHIESKLAVYEAYEYGEIDEYDRDYLLESLDDIMYEKFGFGSHKTKEQKARHKYLKNEKPFSQPFSSDISDMEHASKCMKALSKATVEQNPTLSRKLNVMALMFDKSISILRGHMKK